MDNSNTVKINHKKVAQWISATMFLSCLLIMAFLFPSRSVMSEHLSDGLMKTVHRGTIAKILDNCKQNYECVKTIYVDVEGQRHVANSAINSKGLSVGDDVWVHQANGVYNIYDFDNTYFIIGFVIIACLLLIRFGGKKAFFAILGIIISSVAAMFYIVPATLDGTNVGLATFACGSVVLGIIMIMTHGDKTSTYIAYCGTVMSLLITSVLVMLVINFVGVSNSSSDQAASAALQLPGVPIEHIMIASIIISALGLFNDISVSQAATVRELAKHNPQASRKALFHSSIDIGKDHLASIIYTLAMVFFGTALPALIIHGVYTDGIVGTLLSGEFATELITTSIYTSSLALAVPITTVVASYFESDGNENEIETVVHAH